ncbi:MAG: hydrogenase nickel incorporation protein HypB [Rhodospirillaceae bacterium]|nr:MAG: hydrogenase nickel incorporation protein HypB [Rhodospirillaceae bacterium]
MCESCGCTQGPAPQDHHHGDHAHDHAHAHDHDSRTIQVETHLLAHNNALAEVNRHWLCQRGIHALTLMSSPGSGKTLLLERTLQRLQ